jgi:hypothetical protein
MRMITNIMTNNDPNNKAKIRQAYIDHYAHVRAVVPKDNLLELRSEDGWEPLCKFLASQCQRDRIRTSTMRRRWLSCIISFGGRLP